MLSVVKWLRSLVFHHLDLVSIAVGSNPPHGNLCDSLRTSTNIRPVRELKET